MEDNIKTDFLNDGSCMFCREGLDGLLFISLRYIHKNFGFHRPEAEEVKQPGSEDDLSPLTKRS